jgi:hypothetical protein
MPNLHGCFVFYFALFQRGKVGLNVFRKIIFYLNSLVTPRPRLPGTYPRWGWPGGPSRSRPTQPGLEDLARETGRSDLLAEDPLHCREQGLGQPPPTVALLVPPTFVAQPPELPDRPPPRRLVVDAFSLGGTTSTLVA